MHCRSSKTLSLGHLEVSKLQPNIKKQRTQVHTQLNYKHKLQVDQVVIVKTGST